MVLLIFLVSAYLRLRDLLPRWTHPWGRFCSLCWQYDGGIDWWQMGHAA